MILIAMGVSGAGKSKIGEMLAERLHCAFTDGDAFHSAANKEKMHHGIPLTDEDRWPSLKRSYRDVWRDGDKDVCFVYLKGTREVLEERLTTRTGHFFDPSLLQSQ